MSNCWANSANVFSPFKAANATFALNAGLWFRRARFVIDSLLIRSHPGRYQAETPLIALFKFAEPALTKVLPLSGSQSGVETSQECRDEAALLRRQRHFRMPRKTQW